MRRDGLALHRFSTGHVGEDLVGQARTLYRDNELLVDEVEHRHRADEANAVTILRADCLEGQVALRLDGLIGRGYFDGAHHAPLIAADSSSPLAHVNLPYAHVRVRK